MGKNYLEGIRLIYESMHEDISSKNLFYGLKAMLDDGDDFKLIDTQNEFIKDKLECRFIYKGTRYISVTVFPPVEDPSYEGSLWVIIYEKNSTGKYSGSWTNESDDGGYYPVIKTVSSFVQFIKASLDENDGDDDEPEYDPAPTNPSKKRSPNLVGV